MTVAVGAAAALPVRSVAVQVVLFRNDATSLFRLAEAISAAARHALAHTELDRVVVRFGDCSPAPCITPDDRRRIDSLLADVETGYEFFDANLGSAGGSNALAVHGDEDAIWILNPDTYPAPRSMAHLIEVLGTAGVAIAEARQIPIDHPKAYDPSTGETGWAVGFALMIRRTVFDQVGGFDERFFPMYCDDVDLSWRVRAAGWSVRHVPRSVVFHDKPIEHGGAVRWSEDAARHSHLARLWLYRKYLRPDLEAAFLERIDEASDPVAARAIDEFRRRVAAGETPAPVPDANRVAVFDGDAFAAHRFEYRG